MKKIAIFVLVALCNFSITQAQEPNRDTPPPLEKPKNLDLPSIERFDLSNGINVLFMQKMNVPSVQVNLLVETGTFDDPQGKEGLADFTLDLIDEGAGKLDALALAEEIEFLGATIRTYSSNFHSGVNCFTTVSKIGQALTLMSDIVLRPQFDSGEINRIRAIRLNSLLQDYDEPAVIARRAFGKYLFPNELPYGRFATQQTLNNITAEDITNFYQNNFVTGNSTLIVVGAIDLATLKKLLEENFGSLKKGKRNEKIYPVAKPDRERRIILVDKPGAAQSVIRIGTLSEPRSTPDYYNMVVLNTILGGSFTSRLNTNLREQHGYSYGAGSFFSFWPVAGPFVAASSVQTDVTAEALKEFFIEFDKIHKPIPEDEFLRGKNYEALGYAANFETNADIANALSELVLFGLGDSYFNEYIKNVLSVNRKNTEVSARKYIKPEEMLVVIVGDRGKVQSEIEKLKLGKVTTVSVEDVLGKKPDL